MSVADAGYPKDAWLLSFGGTAKARSADWGGSTDGSLSPTTQRQDGRILNWDAVKEAKLRYVP